MNPLEMSRPHTLIPEPGHAIQAAEHARVYTLTWPPGTDASVQRNELKNLIDHGFYFQGLSADDKEDFLTWSERFEMLPDSATTFEIYYAADPRLMAVLSNHFLFRRQLSGNMSLMLEISNSPGSTELRVYKRIAHIVNTLLRMELPGEMLKALGTLLNNMTYQPPWDDEEVIRDSLKILTLLCRKYFPEGGAGITAAFTDDLSGCTLRSEFDRLQALFT